MKPNAVPIITYWQSVQTKRIGFWLPNICGISIVNVLQYISGYSAGQLCELKWNWLHMSTKMASWLKEIAEMFQKVKLVLRKDILFTDAKDHFPGPPFAIQSWPPSNTNNYYPCSTTSKSSKRQIMSKEECNKHSCSQLFY